MKLTKTLLIASVMGAMAFAASQASAFPLYLKSCSGTISATPSYSAIINTNKAKYTTQSFNLKKIMVLVSNTVVVAGFTAPPKDAQIVFDPYYDKTYLTNSSGYYQNLSYSGLNGEGYCEMYIEDMATSFKTSGSNSGSESDKVIVEFYVRGIAPDGGIYYAGADYGAGSLKYSGNDKGVKMTISAKGADYGEIGTSWDGVSTTSISFSGSSAQPEWSGPYSLWWD